METQIVLISFFRLEKKSFTMYIEVCSISVYILSYLPFVKQRKLLLKDHWSNKICRESQIQYTYKGSSTLGIIVLV